MNQGQQSYFKLYNSLFENESTSAVKMTDMEKILLMLASSELNRKEAESEATQKMKVMAFSHWWLSTALSCKRKSLSKPLKKLSDELGLFDYSKGYKMEDGSGSAPSTIRNLQKEERFIPFDRYTFEVLLYEKVKDERIKYRHILVYALCQYIQQFRGGSICINEFGWMLGMRSKRVKADRILPFLEDLESMKLISFKKGHAFIEGVEVHPLTANERKQEKLRSRIKMEAKELRYQEYKVKNPEVAASAETVDVPKDYDGIIQNVKELYFKISGRRKAILTQDQNEKMWDIYQNVLTIEEMHECIMDYFDKKKNDALRFEPRKVFTRIILHIQEVHLDRWLQVPIK